MAHWWECSPPTNVAWVRLPVPVSCVGWFCCWFSSLLREVFLRVLRFSPLLKNQHIQIPIRSWICPQLTFCAKYRWHLNKVIYPFLLLNVSGVPRSYSFPGQQMLFQSNFRYTAVNVLTSYSWRQQSCNVIMYVIGNWATFPQIWKTPEPFELLSALLGVWSFQTVESYAILWSHLHCSCHLICITKLSNIIEAMVWSMRSILGR